MDDANHPWLVLVPRIADVTELIDLGAAQRTQLKAEIDATSRALKRLFKLDKFNIAAPGNILPQCACDRPLPPRHRLVKARLARSQCAALFS